MAYPEKNSYSEEAAKSDAAVMAFIVLALLPNSRKGKYTSFEEIMNAGGIWVLKISREDVRRLVDHTESYCAGILFSRRRIDWENPTEEGKDIFEYRIDPNNFYSLEERQHSSYSSIMDNYEKN